MFQYPEIVECIADNYILSQKIGKKFAQVLARINTDKNGIIMKIYYCIKKINQKRE